MANFNPEHLKTSKLELWWDPFIQSRKFIDLKSTEESCVMIMNNDAKFEEESTSSFKTDMMNLADFDSSTQKSKQLGLWWDPFIQSKKCMNLKFTEQLCVMTIKNDAKIEEEMTCRFNIDMRNLTNFDPSVQKSQKFAL